MLRKTVAVMLLGLPKGLQLILVILPYNITEVTLH
jgi:hypothetical protein